MPDLRNVFRKCPAFAQISGNQERPAEDPGWGMAQGEKERLREGGGAHKESPFCKGEDLLDPLSAGPHPSESPWRHIFPEDSSPSSSGDWEEMLTHITPTVKPSITRMEGYFWATLAADDPKPVLWNLPQC